ncbi:putative cyclase [Lanmaoa asiatica]|nr:putative cyclase [Lanmaoa asiatica]
MLGQSMDPATIVDLSHPLLEPVPCYPGDPEFKMSLACSSPLIAPETVPIVGTFSIETDSHMVVRVHALSLGTHTGTHIDAPFHFFPSGQKLHEIPLAQFVGHVVILDVRHLAQDRSKISWADVTNRGGTGTGGDVPHIDSSNHALVHAQTVKQTSYFSGRAGTSTGVRPDVAIALHDLGAKIVGVDVLSPDETPADENTETEHGWGMHETLLGHGVLICENLKGLGGLTSDENGGEEETWVSLMPMSIHNADGAPVRAYGWKQSFAAH